MNCFPQAAAPTLTAFILSFTCHTALAQANYPNKVVTLVVPSSATASESEARILIQSIEAKHPDVHFIVEQRPGAGSTMGTTYVAKARPDGYTLLVPNGAFTLSTATYPDLAYDETKDFTPITMFTQKALLLLVNPNTPFKSVKEYLDYARANSGKLNYSTGGSGSATHLPGALLHQVTKTKVTFVHYKRSADRILDLVAGRVDASSATYGTILPQIKAGKVRPLAVTTIRRISIAPDLPTIAESGVPGFDYSTWTGLIGPARMPPSVVEKLHRLWTDALKDPVAIKKFEADGSNIIGSSPAEFQQFIVTDVARWKSLVNETGIKLQED